jgi:hypothetical protein
MEILKVGVGFSLKVDDICYENYQRRRNVWSMKRGYMSKSVRFTTLLACDRKLAQPASIKEYTFL